VRQLSLFGTSNPIVEDLKRMDVSSMTPLEAISKLYELHNQAQGG
jgi:DNA mismatch repair protein MutS